MNVIAVLALLAVFSIAHAQYVGDGEVEVRARVSDVLMKPEVGQFVVIKGRLTKRLDDGVFMFTDDTAEILVRCDPKTLLGKLVSATSTVEIRGRVVEDFRSTPEIEVLRLDVISY